MNFYNNTHPFYCGIDLHARILYICIIDAEGNTVVHQEIKADPKALLRLLKPYQGNVVVGVECMHCWYWVSDFCSNEGIDFILGHALYMKAIHGGKAKNDRIDSYKIASLMRGGNFPLAYTYPKEMRATRDLLRRRMKIVQHGAHLKAHVANTSSQYNLGGIKVNLKNACCRKEMKTHFPDPVVQRNIDMDIRLLENYKEELSSVECFIQKQVKQHAPKSFTIVKSISGIGPILGLTIVYEIGDILRFDSVQKFASYSRLVKCKAESANKLKGHTPNN